MSDDFLSRLREEPRPQFARGLEARLRETGETKATAAGPGAWLRPVLAGVFAAAIVAAVFALPPVRATAREFLDLFRVQRFAAVPVDTERFARLERSGLDLKTLVGGQVEVLQEPGQGEAVESLEVASALAGIDVRPPASPPERARLVETRVSGPAAFRVRLDTEKLRSLAELVGVEDATIRPEWEGATVEVHAPPLVAMRYRRGDEEFVLVQSRGPEVALPEGVDLAELGALGLQMAGMSATEARLFAHRIDWRSTLLVPIPAEGGNFREVEVGGRKGLLVAGRGRTTTDDDGTVHPGRWRCVLLWADEDQVYAAMGPGHGVEVLEMAQSIERR